MGRSVAMPDVHSGYGFAIGNVAAFDMVNRPLLMWYDISEVVDMPSLTPLL